jgi:hypothetical protein
VHNVVRQHVVVPAAEVFDVDQAGPAAVGAVHNVVRLTGGGWLVTPAAGYEQNSWNAA